MGISRRTLLRRASLSAVGAAGVGFIALGPRGGRERSDGRLVLDYWEKWTGLEGRAMQRVVEEYNQSQSRIFVRYFSTNAIDQKTQVAIAGGNPPDIVGLWNYNVPAYADLGAIIPLSEISVPEQYRVRLERYAAAMRPVMYYNGKVWAVVNTGGCVALYYNKDLFAQAKIANPPSTIEELNIANHKLTAISSTGQIERVGFVHLEPGWWSFIWGDHFGGRLYDGETKRSLLGSNENIAAFEWLQSYSKRFGMGDDVPGADDARNKQLRSLSLADIEKFRSSFGNYDSGLNAFLSGKIATVVQGPWLANVINAYKPELNYGVVPFPVSQNVYDPAAPIGLIDTDVLVIPTGSRHPEAAMEFIAFTQQQHIVEMLSTVHCKNSTLAEVSPDFIAKHPNKGISTFAAIASSPRGFRCPPTRTWLQFKDLCDALMQQVWTQKGEPAKLLAAAQARTQSILDVSERGRMLRRT